MQRRNNFKPIPNSRNKLKVVSINLLTSHFNISQTHVLYMILNCDTEPCYLKYVYICIIRYNCDLQVRDATR
jgi:hypothetical protein